MPKNKTSVWSVIILVATIISLILLATSATLTSLAIPEAYNQALAAAQQQGATGQDAEFAASLAVTVIIVALVFASAFDVLKIVGGFLFSLKGRWGVFCIVVSILSLVFGIWSLISNITNKAGVGTIVTGSISLAVSVLLVIACFKHRAENQKA